MSSSFYKLLLTDDFNSQLRLPPQFVKDHADILSGKVTLRIQSGESWIVKIKRIGKHYFFTDGWEIFCRDVDLEFKQFLLFWFDPESGFSVSVYDISGCEKELIVRKTSGGSEQHVNGVSRHREFAVKSENEDEDVKIDEEHAGKKWRFHTKLKKLHETELEIPRDFSKATGIVGNGKIFLVTHLQSQKWPVFVTARKDGSLAMSAGWNDFLVGRKVCVGSTILFEFLSCRGDKIIEAKVLKNGNKGLYYPKKRRGRPPNLESFDQNIGL